jgi:hypothetical protein
MQSTWRKLRYSNPGLQTVPLLKAGGRRCHINMRPIHWSHCVAHHRQIRSMMISRWHETLEKNPSSISTDLNDLVMKLTLSAPHRSTDVSTLGL